MASFQAKICMKRLRKRANKNYISVTFLPDGLEKIPKKSKKIKKIPLWLLFKVKQVEKCPEREKIKIIGLFRSYTTCNRKFQKNSKKIQKILKYYCGFISSHPKSEQTEKQEK